MPRNIVNSLVFHGHDLAVSMFEAQDFREAFGSPAEEQLIVGSMGRFRYARGDYEVRIDEDRIELLSHSRALLLPEALMQAAQKVVLKIAPVRSTVSAVGINCDCVFPASEIGQNGVRFCGALTDSPLAHQFAAQPLATSMTTGVTFALLFDSVWYTVRLEPEAESQGKDLVVSINAHQRVEATDQLEEKVRAFVSIRSRVLAIHNHLKKLQSESGE